MRLMARVSLCLCACVCLFVCMCKRVQSKECESTCFSAISNISFIKENKRAFSCISYAVEFPM